MKRVRERLTGPKYSLHHTSHREGFLFHERIQHLDIINTVADTKPGATHQMQLHGGGARDRRPDCSGGILGYSRTLCTDLD